MGFTATSTLFVFHNAKHFVNWYKVFLYNVCVSAKNRGGCEKLKGQI